MFSPHTTSIPAGPAVSHETEIFLRSERRLPTLLSVIAGMVDMIGFLRLGIFTAHITGNIVVVGAIIVRHNQVNPAQILAIPFFIFAVAATWLIAKVSGRQGSSLKRLVLLIQFLLIACVLIISVITNPPTDPHGPMATIAAMVAVTAMGCQFAFLRLILPVAPSTAVMTGNLTNTVLSMLDTFPRSQPLMKGDTERLRGSLPLLLGFAGGCAAAAAAVSLLGDWAWSFPLALAGAAVKFP